jgi:hypothetical protein
MTSINEFVEALRTWENPPVRMMQRGGVVPERRGQGWVMVPLVSATITAARRNDQAPDGYDLLRFAFDYQMGTRVYYVRTSAGRERRPPPGPDPWRLCWNRLELEGYFIEDGEWTPEEIEQALKPVVA